MIPSIELLFFFFCLRLVKNRYHLYTLHPPRPEDHIFHDSPTKIESFDMKWFLFQPPPNVWNAPRKWVTDPKRVVKPRVGNLASLREQFCGVRRAVLQGVPSYLYDYLSVDRLIQARWIQGFADAPQHWALRAMPNRPPTAHMDAEEGDIPPREEHSPEGVDLPDCFPFFFFLSGFFASCFR